MTKLDDRVAEIFRTLGIPCFGSNGQIRLIDLDPNARVGDHLEFDFIARIGSTGLMLEVTEEKRNQRREILKFVRHCDLFVDSPQPWEAKIKLLRGIPRATRPEFEGIRDWKYVYVGTSPEIIAEGLDRHVAPSKPLYVFNQEHYDYLRFLSGRIGKFARFELFGALDLTPQDVEEEESEVKAPAIALTNRKISGNMGFVDLYVFTISVLSLLKMAKVIRYGSLDSWIPEVGENYQRLLSADKLERMRVFLNKEKDHSSFPNAVTVVLSQRVTSLPPEGGRVTLRFPLEYGSIQVIDGQHRLFAYAGSDLTEDELKKARLVVVGIKFRGTNQKKNQQWSARTFVEINKEQTKVPTELIDLISYSAMGDVSPKSLAARVLVELNINRNGPLSDVFRTRPFQKKNSAGGRPVRIVSVTNQLERLFRAENANDVSTVGIHESFSDGAWRHLRNKKADPIVSEGKMVVNSYFTIVSHVFDGDWKSKNSLIFTSNYMATFCRLLVDFKANRLTDQVVRERFEAMKSGITTWLPQNGGGLGPEGEVLLRGGVVPQVGGANKSEPAAIYEFLRQRAQI